MKISELIAALEAIKAEKGDLPVVIYGDHDYAKTVSYEFDDYCEWCAVSCD